jgi:hypothetical protein
MRQLAAFTRNKQVVRDLQFEFIKLKLSGRLGKLSYFGLPSDGMYDAIQWAPVLSRVMAVERGALSAPWETQYALMRTAFVHGLLGKTTLLRDDIDEVILRGMDTDGNGVDYPFDVVSLDYSGGLFYRTSGGEQRRIRAIQRLIQEQAGMKSDYVLLISCNIEGVGDGEVTHMLSNIGIELERFGMNGADTVDAYMQSPFKQARLKLYVPYLVGQVAASQNYQSETENVVFYKGNRGVLMTSYRFYLKHDARTTAPRAPRERLWQVVNTPFLEVAGGRIRTTSLGLPKAVRKVKP